MTVAWRHPSLVVLAAGLLLMSCSGDDDDAADAIPATESLSTSGESSTSELSTTSLLAPEPSTTALGDGSETVVDPTTTTTPAPGSSLPGPGDDGSSPASVPTTVPAVVAPTVTLAPAGVGVPEVPPLNEAGLPITIDETAQLACANSQFAWVALQQDDPSGATEELAVASQRAAASAVTAVSAYSDDLAGAMATNDPLVIVEAFLDLCVANGFEY